MIAWGQIIKTKCVIPRLLSFDYDTDLLNPWRFSKPSKR